MQVFSIDHSWQKPAITELHAFNQIKSIKGLSAGPFEGELTYVGFPWATLIDFRNQRQVEKGKELFAELDKIRAFGTSRRVTVCQHIAAAKHIELFKHIGITDLFWSHARLNQSIIDGVRIAPFPLYPVNRRAKFRPANVERTGRKFLFSFVGAYVEAHYLSDIREKIVQDFVHERSFVELKNRWHFEDIVYGKQIHGRSLKKDEIARVDKDTSSFKRLLENSTFTLCPSGSGPNSIRLWETFTYSSIPVIFSNDLWLPGNQQIWSEAALIFPETNVNAKEIMDIMEDIEQDSQKLEKMRRAGTKIVAKYGVDNFIHDIKRLVV